VTVYAWPTGWVPSAFELRILPNTRTFVGAYTPVVQVIDLLGERWQGRIDLSPTADQDEAGAREAFFDRLKGPANQITVWNFRRPVPRGTARGTMTLSASALQGANAVSVGGSAASATYKAGDMLGINGQLVRVMADATANGSGVAVLEIQPRLRAAQSSGAAVAWNQPTCNVMLKNPDGVATTYLPGYADGCSFEFVEVP
jgi:hypothetical protein